LGVADPIRILLVEDNPADVFLIKEAMRTHGIPFDLEWFADGEDAVAHIDGLSPSASIPDAILLDLNLPKLDGKEVLGRIRQNARLKFVPVAILTSSDSPHDRRETARLGASIYIKKPPTLDEFLDVGGAIKDLLEGTVAR
jgi:chemotaxis family two-component system response regulator Rcp1